MFVNKKIGSKKNLKQHEQQANLNIFWKFYPIYPPTIHT